ncbi:hypothetical protein GGI13_000608 [Coemansia sp. RSA 455]|nr:hypothetical protein GGI13_000608 [Coemansia sp. RSA 455]
MDNLSAFQLLPNHVVKLIVDHVAHSSRLRFDGVTTDSDEYKILQMPLLWVCHNFRAFVRERFSRVYELALENDRDRAEALLYSWPSHFKKLGCPTHLLAKELLFKLDVKSVYTGKALQLLFDAPYDGCSFPLVRKLCFKLTSNEEGYYDKEPDHGNDREPEQDNDPEPVLENDREPAHDQEPAHNNNWVFEGDYDDWELEGGNNWDSAFDNDREAEDWALVGTHVCTPKTRYIYPPDTTANITAFVQRIKQMAPAVSEIDVDYYEDEVGLYWRSDEPIHDLIQHLFGIVERHTVITRVSSCALQCLDLEPIRDLVYINYSASVVFIDLVSLVARNARTLQSLDLYVADTDLTGLVRDPAGGGYLEYPCLHTLNVRSYSIERPLKRAAFKDIVPFPRLLRLTVSSRSPFSDDILFRGNAATLEYLAVELAAETVSMLKKCRVFTPTSHPNLKCVILDIPPLDMPDVFASGVEYMQFVLSIAPGASVRHIVELDQYPEDCILELSMFKNHGCIQILYLPSMTLTIWQAITLVELLPLLSDLTTKAPVLGELPQGLFIAELPEYVRSNYAPMGKRLRCWHVYDWPEPDYKEIATCVLLLALACPNFDYAVLAYSRCREPFMKVMQDIIAEPEFSQDAPQAVISSTRADNNFINTPQNFVLQTEDGAQDRWQLSELVTRAAERHFDIVLGQCNWEAVANELGLLLIECLGLFDTSTLMIQPHSLIETYGGWSKRDMEKLMEFIAANYADNSTIDWKLVGAYMNVDALECQHVSQGTSSEPINGVGYRRICEFRDAGLGWKDIHQHFQQYANATLLKIKYYGLEAELSGGTVDELTAEWTDAERKVMKDLIEQHMESTTRLELVDIIKRELPARPSSDISIFTSQYINELKESRLRPNQVMQLRELVDKYGEDWDRIGETLGVLPSSAKRNWLEHGGDRV